MEVDLNVLWPARTKQGDHSWSSAAFRLTASLLRLHL